MKKIYPLFFSIISLFAFEEKIYEKISNIYAPTYEEFCSLQDELQKGNRPYLEWLNFFYPEVKDDYCRYDLRVRNMIFTHKKEPFDLSLQQIFFSEPDNKECCIISYASLNPIRGYPKKIRALKDHLSKVGFTGHLLYRVGGWPNIEGGSLVLMHVPYAFKVAFFKEAQRLGYKKVLWIDAIFEPLKNLDPIFNRIEQDGYFLLSSPHTLREFGSEKLRLSFNLTDEENRNIQTVRGGAIGIHMENEKGIALLDLWHQAALDLDPYLSRRPEENVLAVLAYKLGLPLSASIRDICGNYLFRKPEHFFFVAYPGTKQ